MSVVLPESDPEAGAFVSPAKARAGASSAAMAAIRYLFL
jgi:hypothetical protein